MKNYKNILIAGLVCCALCATATSCRENEWGTVNLNVSEDTYIPVNAAYTFSSHCALYTDADFQRVKASLDNGTAPQAVKDEFQNLKTNTYGQLTYTPNPQKEIVRGDATGTETGSENYAFAMRDAAAAYQTALLWRLTGDDRYAEKSIEILNGWAKTCVRITSNDANQVLAAGAQGYTFANAAGIVYNYSGWASAQREQFKQWMLTVFAAPNRSFLDTHTGSNVCAEHYWSNWDLVNMCSYFSIGVLTENSDIINYVVNYFYQGQGNGCIKRLIRGTHTDPLGSGETICQNQESGRDQGHAQMSMMVTAELCQMAYSLYQGNPTVKELDFFSANDNAIMKMGEYVALSNLKSGTDNANQSGAWLVTSSNMPFQRFEYCQPGCGCKNTSHGAIHTLMAEDSGRGGVRPGWEILLAHYKNVSGHKYIEQMANKLRPENGSGDSRYGVNSGAFDQLGWNTLMLYQ
jgi:hypothetical protein